MISRGTAVWDVFLHHVDHAWYAGFGSKRRCKTADNQGSGATTMAITATRRATSRTVKVRAT